MEDFDWDRLENIVRELNTERAELQAVISSIRMATEDMNRSVNKANNAAGWIAMEVSRVKNVNWIG
jgi:fructose-1,6-bisphosphatase